MYCLLGGTRRLTIDLIAGNTPFTPTISTDRSVGSGSSARMRMIRRREALGVVTNPSVDDLVNTSDIDSFASFDDSFEPISLAAAPASATLYKDTPIVGNILTQGLSPRDALVSNTPNPASDTQTSIAANGYSFIQSGQQYKILVR